MSVSSRRIMTRGREKINIVGRGMFKIRGHNDPCVYFGVSVVISSFNKYISDTYIHSSHVLSLRYISDENNNIELSF